MPLYDDFRKLRKDFMPAPFWFWNDDLQPDELRRQIAEMDAHNIGGFYMHARMGRVTPYMSDRWIECVRTCVDEAERRGMNAWIYDEDNWPSGYGGGVVNALGSHMLQRYLFCDIVPIDRNEGPPLFQPEGETLAVFGVREAEDARPEIRRLTHDDFRALHDETADPGFDRLMIFRFEAHDRERFFCPECSTQGYVDILNPEVTRAFIDQVYEKYARAVGDRFGTAVPGFFTDEPSYHELDWRHNLLRLPWTGALPERFRELNGGDLVDQLPALVTKTGDWFRVRRDYYLCLARLFAENFTQPLAAWCEEHGCLFTGHYIVEESLPGSAQCTGNPMLHYLHQHVPGIDHLGKDIDLAEFWSSARVLVKQPASVAHQFDKPRIMIETFAGGGWDFGPAEQKWMGDWLYALGVSLLCQHAFHYSLRGYRKRDYPPSLSYQQPWWPASSPLGAHFARLGWMLTRGRRVVDLLVLHPLESQFGVHRVDGYPWPQDTLTDAFEKITADLLAHQIDFDYGDEELLALHGAANGARLEVGRGAYAAVLVPHAHTWRSSTLDLLERFLDSGGIVWTVDPSATREDARLSDRVGRLLARGRNLGAWDDAKFTERLVTAMEEELDLPFRIESDDAAARSIVHQVRDVEEGRILFLTSDARTPHRARVLWRGAGRPERWDTVTGEASALPVQRRGDALEFELPFDDGVSHLVVFRETDRVAPPDPALFGAVEEEIVAAREGDALPYRLHAPNTLFLDMCRLKLGSVSAEDPIPVLEAQQKLQTFRAGVRCTAEFRWESDIEVGDLSLLVETPEAFERVLFNGAEIDLGAHESSWIETHLRRLALPGPMQPGANTLTLEFRSGGALELEPVYVAGSFGVRLRDTDPPRVVALPETLRVGCWTGQGLPFYAGAVTYTLESRVPPTDAGEGVWFVDIESLRNAASVEIDGIEAGVVCWRPFRVRAPVRRGKEAVRLGITVSNSLRNFYGPHHLDHEDAIDCLGPHNFFETDHWTPEYRVKPAGLLGAVRWIRCATPA